MSLALAQHCCKHAAWHSSGAGTTQAAVSGQVHWGWVEVNQVQPARGFSGWREGRVGWGEGWSHGWTLQEGSRASRSQVLTPSPRHMAPIQATMGSLYLHLLNKQVQFWWAQSDWLGLTPKQGGTFILFHGERQHSPNLHLDVACTCRPGCSNTG